MNKDLVKGRALLVLGRAVDDWLLDARRIGAAAGPAGNLSSDQTLLEVLSAFRERSEPRLDEILNQVSNALRGRGRTWNQSLDIVQVAIEERYGMIAEWTIGMGFASTDEQKSHARQFIEAHLNKMKADVEGYRFGFTERKLEDLTQRRPVLWAGILLIMGAIVGALASEVIPRLL